jgi:hypothetical protein
MGDGPIFIGGLSYSGKTQLRLMLNAHPDIVITRRTAMWPRYYDRFGDLERDGNLAAALDAMFADAHVRSLNPDRRRIEREFMTGPRTYARLFGLFHAHNAEARGKRRWGDQLGRVEQYAVPIFGGFPEARLIHMVRDPRERYAVVRVSSRSRRGKPGWETAQWLDSARLARRNAQRFPGRTLTVRYEDLASDPERTLRAVCAFLGETFRPSMLPTAVEESIGGRLWRASPAPLGARETAYIEQHAAGELSAFGYCLLRPSLSPRERLLSTVIDAPLNAGGALAWRLSGAGTSPRPEASHPGPASLKPSESVYEQ